MRKCYLLLAVSFVVLSNSAFAQPQFSGWLANFNTFKTGKKTSIHNDNQWRSSDDIKHMQTLLLRVGVNVELNKSVIATAGYAYISNRRSVMNVTGYAPEHRIWEQLIINHKISRIATAHRFWLEQRFISKSVVQNNELKNDGSVFANRIRYFIRNLLPLKGRSQI